MAEGSPRETKAPRPESEQNLLVAVRVRPISEDEIIQGATPVAYAVNKKVVVLMDPQDDPDDVLRANRSREKSYAFDHAFDGSASQEEVYEQTARFLIPSVIQGYNATVFAYGATGAGKTYTMLGTDEEPGIMARSLNDLFLEMRRTGEEMAYQVTMSYLEIYNEMIRDLLNPSSGFLEIREDPKGVQVSGLTEVTAKSTKEVMGILVRGNLERTCEPTAANKTSSRSHAVLQIHIKQRQRLRSVRNEVRHGRLFLIDLAGSERAANTHNTGKRMVEGAHINRSLLALGNCINALCDKNGARYVNYRDSKLTRLLKEALGGNCRTVMIAHASPASNQYEESRNTLVYADRAKNIKTKVRRNVMDVSYHIAQYTNIIAELREEVKRLHVRLDAANKKSVSGELLRSGHSELDRLKEQLLDVFREQMDLRRNLMDMNNTAMEISLDYTRSNLVIKKWEREKALRQRHGNNFLTDEHDSSTFLTEAKARDRRGEESVEPAEVAAARQELATLADERQRTENLRTSITRELADAKDKAAKIEEMLPRVITHREQQEVLSLLCKVHELEIENMEMQSACLLRNFELRKKDLVLLTYEQHRLLCDDIISQQRALMEQQQVAVSKELDELYELYQQEGGDLALDRHFSLPDIRGSVKNGSISNQSRKLVEMESVSDLTVLEYLHRDGESNSQKASMRPQIQLPKEVQGINSVAAKRRLQSVHRVQEENKTLFSRSPRAKEIMREKALAKATDKSATSLTAPDVPPPVLPPHLPRQQSIVTLSNSHSNSTSPLPGNESPKNIEVASYSDVEDEVLMRNPEKRKLIATGTRHIAALAVAKRRTKQQSDAINIRHKLGLEARGGDAGRTFVNAMPRRGAPEAAEKLTRSRLALHNNSHIEPHIATDSDRDVGGHQERGQTRHKGATAVKRRQQPIRNGQLHRVNGKPVARHRLRQDPSYQELAKSTPRSKSRPDNPRVTGPNKRSRLPAPTHPMPKQNLEFNFGGDMVVMEANNSMGSSTVRQNGPEKGRGMTVQKKVRGPAPRQTLETQPPTKSPTSTGSQAPEQPTRPPPTIPVYGTADIGITGFALQ